MISDASSNRCVQRRYERRRVKNASVVRLAVHAKNIYMPLGYDLR